MPAPISGPPGASFSPSPRPTAQPGLSLNLLQPVSSLLALGQQAQAEVISIQQTQQSFDVMLKLQVEPGRETTVKAQSPQAISPGTQLIVQAAANNQLLTQLAGPGNPALNQLDLQELPLGTLLQGKVVSVEQLLQGKSQQIQFRVLLELLNTPLRGRLLTLDSPRALAPGNLLSALVQGPQALQWLSPSSQLDSLELQQQLAPQLARQIALEQLLPSLAQLKDSAQLPADAKQSLLLLLGKLPSGDQLQDPTQLKQLLHFSGLNLEALLQQGGNSAQQAAQLDLKAQLLRLVATLLPHTPQALSQQVAQSTSSAGLAGWLKSYLQQKELGLNPSFPLPNTALNPKGEQEADLPLLLRLASSALARLQSHQLSSLQQSQTLADGTQLQTWQYELPYREGSQWHGVQIRLQEEKHTERSKQAGSTLWRIDLALQLEPLGPMHVRALWQNDEISTHWWAEHAQTFALVEQALPSFAERLRERGLKVGEMHCQHGQAPSGSKTGLQQRWIDETA